MLNPEMKWVENVSKNRLLYARIASKKNKRFSKKNNWIYKINFFGGKNYF